MTEATAEIQQRPPLGIPRGSVRALLALLVVAVVIIQMVRDQDVPLLWSETLLVVLTHYFTSRRAIALAPDVYRRLQEEGALSHRQKKPLFLPEHTIRGVIVLAFIGLAVHLYREGRLFDQETVSLLGIVFAYFIGLVVSAVIHWWTGGVKTPSVQWWEDLKALVSLLVLGVTSAVYIADCPEILPMPIRESALGIVLFYFGSRR